MGKLGQANRVSDSPVTPRTLFGVGSLSKTFLSMAAMIAQERRLLTIDQPIKEMAPSLPVTNRWHDTHPVRLVHLLEHTAGFDEAPFNLAVRTDADTPLDEVVEAGKNSLVARWKPGDYYAYNNLGGVVAAHTIEKAVGIPFEDFVKGNVLLPLGMTQATYHPDEDRSPYLSTGYTGTDYQEVSFPNLPQWPAGSLVASVEDMSNMVRTLLNHGRFDDQQILSRTSVRAMETPETSIKARQGVRYGYGKGLMMRLQKGHLFYGHGGRYGGFLSDFGYSRKLGVGYVILINNVDGRKAVKRIRQALLNRIIPDQAFEAQVTSSVEADAKVPVGIIGCYQPIAPSMDMAQFIVRLVDLQFVVEADGQLYQKSILGDELLLIPVGSNRFKKPGEPIATSAFVKDTDGRWLWLDETTYQRIPMWWGYVQFYTVASCLVTMLLSFLVVLVWLPVRWVKKKKYLLLQLLPLLTFLAFAGMVVSFFILSGSLDTFTVGAVLFFVFGWAFLLLSLVGLWYALRAIYRQLAARSWVKYQVLVTSLACSVVALYLLYWNVIGLMLWSY